MCVFFLSGSAFYLSAFMLSANAIYGNLMPYRCFTWLSEPLLIAAQQTTLFVSGALLPPNKMNNIEQAMNWRKFKKQNGKQAK